MYNTIIASAIHKKWCKFADKNGATSQTELAFIFLNQNERNIMKKFNRLKSNSKITATQEQCQFTKPSLLDIKKIFLAGLAMLILTFPHTLIADQAREIMERNDALPKGNTGKSEATLLIFKGGCHSLKCAEKKNFILETIRLSSQETHSLISFTSPTQLKFLTWSKSGQDSSQWIKPSRSGVRKIASSDKGNSFVNSHFFYEDMSDRNINDYSYSYLGAASVGDDPVHKIEARKKGSSPVYSKSIIYVRQADSVIVRIDLFQQGRHSKTVYNERIEKIQGIFTPRKVVMERTDGRGKSILYLRNIRYNVPVSRARMKPAAM